MSARRRGQARGQGGQGPAEGTGSSNRGSSTRGASRARGRAVPQFDGTASRGSPAITASQPASNVGSRGGSVAVREPKIPAAAPGDRPRDPALDPGRATEELPTDSIKNVDVPASFFNINNQSRLETKLAKRPGFNPTGKALNLPTNSYLVTQLPQKQVYQYDVVIGNGKEKRAVTNKVWNSAARKEKTGPDMIFDGNKLAWSIQQYQEIRVMVDLDVEEGKLPRQGDNKDKNTFRLAIKPTKLLDPSVIYAYLEGKIQLDSNILEAVNFLDHLLREGPSQNQNLVPVKRSFFARNSARADLGGAVEVFRGAYQSIRLAQGAKMVINLDVANTTFWKPQPVTSAIIEKNRYRDINMIAQKMSNPNERIATVKYLKKLSVKARYNGNPQPNTVWKMENIVRMTPNDHKIDWRDPQTKQPTGEKVTVAAYFKRKYNVPLQYSNLPMVQMTKKIKNEPIYFPMELLVIVENQRYAAKLDEIQTSNMIKFAVSPPSVRAQSIEEGKKSINWAGDTFLRNYGLRINDQQLVTQARLLPPPRVKFSNVIEKPMYNGRWDLRNKKFITPNPTALKVWGIGVFPGNRAVNKGQVDKFTLDFVKQYRGHGGVIENASPHIMQLNQDPARGVEELFTSTGNRFNARPQILLFIVTDRNSQHYLRIKKSCDIRYGVVSQVMQAAQVAKANPQYISNVLMKVNAKLGGATAQALPDNSSAFSGKFDVPTVFIGADVSHASPGSEQPSMAAVTVSFDRFAGRYAAACQTNGLRVEMITDQNMRSLLGPLLTTWMNNIGGGRTPQQIYYMRDGVSEGQFIKVIQQEVVAIRGIMDSLANDGKWAGKITAISAGKRHHIRAFPKGQDGDKKGNPQPGTLIERDVTSALDFDFFLYSHIALQGTSRPVHYTVLLDEANHSAAALQNMIYEHCYQYMRSTTSVSMHPAIYYAHLASNRAKAHENIPASAGPSSGSGFKQNQPSSSDKPSSSDTPKLMEMQTPMIKNSMWYI